MSGDDLKKRIEALNRKPLKNVPREDSAEIRGLRRKLQRQAAKSASPVFVAPASERSKEIVYARMPVAGPGVCAESRPAHSSVRLKDVVDGRVVEAPAGPGYYLIEKSAVDLESEAWLVHRRFISLTGHPDSQAVERIAHLCGAERVAPEDVLFLDLETTGLGTTPIFLVGTMECSAEGFRFRQYFARDYSEEISMLAAASERLKSARLLVTFNGKSFDEPYMRSRAAATGVRFEAPGAHLDLLHEARRKYRWNLPNCRLQTLEQMVCGRYREEDIPSSEIPAAYHEFVRTGDAGKISLILHHNLYDLLTMAELMHRLWGRQ